MPNRKTRKQLIDERNEVRLAMARAFSRDEMPEYDRLNRHLEWLNRKIKKGKT